MSTVGNAEAARVLRGVLAILLAACSSEETSGPAGSEGGTSAEDEGRAGGGAGNAAGGSGAAGMGANSDEPRPTEGGCESPGWSELRIAWNDLGYGDVHAGGFTLCAPPGWSVMGMPTNPSATNTGFRLDPDAPDDWAMTSVAGGVHATHENALLAIGYEHSATCGQLGHAVEYGEVNGWPAIHVRDQGMFPTCGACPLPTNPPPGVLSVKTAVVIETFVVYVRGQASDVVPDDVIADLLAIGRSLTTDDEISLPSAAVLDQDLQALRTREFPTCPR